MDWVNKVGCSELERRELYRMALWIEWSVLEQRRLDCIDRRSKCGEMIIKKQIIFKVVLNHKILTFFFVTKGVSSKVGDLDGNNLKVNNKLTMDVTHTIILFSTFFCDLLLLLHEFPPAL